MRVLAPYVGGGFGAGLRVVAARDPGRARGPRGRPPGQAGADPPADVHRRRPPTRARVQHIRLGRHPRRRAGRDRPRGDLDRWRWRTTTSSRSRWARPRLYACPNVATRDQQRAAEHPAARPRCARPATAEGNFALESAHGRTGLRAGHGSARAAAAQLRRGPPADRAAVVEQRAARVLRASAPSGSAGRGATPSSRSMRDGHWLVGYGMAGVSLPLVPGAAARPARRISRDGTAAVRSAATRHRHRHLHGHARSWPRTCSACRSAQVRFELGDSDMPRSPAVGRLRARGVARQRRPRRLPGARAGVPRPGRDDTGSPLHGCRLDDVAVATAHPPPRRPGAGETLHRHPRPARAWTS